MDMGPQGKEEGKGEMLRCKTEGIIDSLHAGSGPPNPFPALSECQVLPYP